MIRRLRWLALSLLLLQTPTLRAETLTISTNNTPLDQRTLQALTEEAFQRLGLELKLVSLPSERSLLSAQLGEVDGEGLRVAGLTAQYPNLVQVPESYVRISFVAFAKDATIHLDQTWASLKPYSVAFITGWKMFEANTGSARIVHKVEKPEQIFQMLNSGRVDLALYTQADGLALVRKLGLTSIAPVTPALKDVDMYLYLNKKHQDWVPKLAKTLREMKTDGSYNRIMAAIHAEH